MFVAIPVGRSNLPSVLPKLPNSARGVPVESNFCTRLFPVSVTNISSKSAETSLGKSNWPKSVPDSPNESENIPSASEIWTLLFPVSIVKILSASSVSIPPVPLNWPNESPDVPKCISKEPESSNL